MERWWIGEVVDRRELTANINWRRRIAGTGNPLVVRGTDDVVMFRLVDNVVLVITLQQ